MVWTPWPSSADVLLIYFFAALAAVSGPTWVLCVWGEIGALPQGRVPGSVRIRDVLQILF
jgi:hypothetical protein